MLERRYQANLIKRIERMFPGCIVLKNDPNYRQGIPDLLILYKHRWAALEVKSLTSASNQPNQAYYISKMNDMSFASFINPEIEEDVLYALQQTLEPNRAARVPQRK